MMVRKCDRCGKRIDETDYVRVEVFLRRPNQGPREDKMISSLDLCRGCDREFHQRFLQEVKQDGR